jgi:hypothetical protein
MLLSIYFVTDTMAHIIWPITQQAGIHVTDIMAIMAHIMWPITQQAGIHGIKGLGLMYLK